MARKDLPHALTLERFATGKDGRANAFKKKKQGELLPKRRFFEPSNEDGRRTRWCVGGVLIPAPPPLAWDASTHGAYRTDWNT